VRRLPPIFLLCCVLVASYSACAEEIWTDANIVTGLDLSGSIEARDAQVQVDGIAMAIRSPEILTAIQTGRYGRIGFAVFVWADSAYPILASWRMIGSPEDALAASEEIAERLSRVVGTDATIKLGALTDLSGAIEHAGSMLRNAPFATNHRIINIVGNGIDNVGGGPLPVRDRMVADGITINGVALGYDRAVYEYFRREVIGGPTAFVLAANDPDKLVDVLARKFVTEIVFNVGATDQP
jgi:hypothetical protein